MGTNDLVIYDAPRDLDEAARIAADTRIARVRMPAGNLVWMAFGHELIRELSTDPRVGREPLAQSAEVPYKARFPDYLKETLLFKDDPEHARLRRGVGKWFAPRQIRALQAEIEAECERLLDAMEAKGSPADLIEDYAIPVPIFALTRVLGADRSLAPAFLRWNQVLFGTGAPDPEVHAAVERECIGYLREELARKRGSDGTDLLSTMANIPPGEGALSDDEVISMAMLILVAGFDNTTNYLGNGALALMRHRDQLDYFLADLDGRAAQVTEEVLRHGRQAVGSGLRNLGMPFVALEDFEIDGVPIEAGEVIMLHRPAASHDESVFAHPMQLDVTREDNPHLTLSYGVHACLGAPLARLELQVALKALFRRFPDLRPAGAPEYQKDTMSEAIEKLPVAWGAR